jgi:hypothetical protein
MSARPAVRWWAERGVPIGGSDFHRLGDHPPGAPTTWVEVEGGDVIGALAAGRVAPSAYPKGAGAAARRRRTARGRCRRCDPDLPGRCANPRAASVRLPGDPGPHRWVDDAGRALVFVL